MITRIVDDLPQKYTITYWNMSIICCTILACHFILPTYVKSLWDEFQDIYVINRSFINLSIEEISFIINLSIEDISFIPPE